MTHELKKLYGAILRENISIEKAEDTYLTAIEICWKEKIVLKGRVTGISTAAFAMLPSSEIIKKAFFVLDQKRGIIWTT